MSDTTRKPFAIWKVGDEEYRLKLTTAEIVRLEGKFKMNLMGLITGGIPELGTMIDITHGSMQKFNHGMSRDDVLELFDDYCEVGGNQTQFMTDVLIPIYQVSGFFSQKEEKKTPRRKKPETSEQ